MKAVTKFRKSDKGPLYLSEFFGTLFITLLGTCSIQNNESFAAEYPSFKQDKVVCFAIVNMLVYSFFHYASNISAECSFNPVITFVKMVQGRFDLKTVLVKFDNQGRDSYAHPDF